MSSIAPRTASASCRSSASWRPSAAAGAVPWPPWRGAPVSRRRTWPAPPSAPSRSRCTSPFRSTAVPGPVTPTCWWRRRSRITTPRWRSTYRATVAHATPVIAVVPVETDFSTAPALISGCWTCGFWPPLPPPPAPVPGLYMTQAHFVDDFEGWLKGAPEFEVHILGQKGQTGSLTDYQCAGEKAPAPYYFDQNALDWSGSVMLLSKVQLDAYNAAHPGQNVRVFVVEDDDTACEIKANRDLSGNMLKAGDGAYKAVTAGNDSSSLAQKTFKRASAFQKLWAALASLFNTNDELVGNAVEDVVAGISY